MEWNRLLCSERIRRGRSRQSSGDLRTEFEKDYHRIIGSASFRRLQDKTQVFPLDKSDFIRTRLTHSLEVASFAKSLGQNVSQKILKEVKDPSFKPQYQADICDILECAGLLHDIGNPPFGHFGETVIRDWFCENMDKLQFQGKSLKQWLTPQMQSDFYHFEGNTQALRLVCKLHYLIDEHGMNLTKGLLGTIIKYPVSSLEIDKKSGDIRTKKMGYYYAERAQFAEIQESLGTNGCRHPLAFLLEAADDIAYKTADVEDAFKKGCITYEQLIFELKKGGKGEPEDGDYFKLVALLERKYQQAIEREMSKPAMNAVQNWIVMLQGRLLSCATDCFVKHYREIMSGTFKKELLSEGYGAKIADVLGDIAYRYAFITEPIYKLEIAAETIMHFLLERFVEAAILYDTAEPMTDVQKKLMSLISDNYKAIYKIYSKDRSESEKLYLRLLLVTDSICGMTDSYAKRLYQELSGIL
ncbi:MAG: deoxyguanosinetriphosphate triphosphohydrolase [Lachnospiraceae bacterium]|nr:deoxyguanosinetriphosphate triphosphohydrolase [Lachnospiraceae bacterium]MBQ7776977.1 deoxyguanosinetriphosphate triphosphohydrolase [Lachnospiraceae bacterium]